MYKLGYEPQIRNESITETCAWSNNVRGSRDDSLMTITPEEPQPAAQAPQPQYAAPVTVPKQKNTVGLIGFIIAIVGLIFACIPGALIVGWILLPIGFILSIVGLCLSGKKKGLSIAGLIISVVGTIVGFVVFSTVVVTSIDEAFSGGDVTVEQPEATAGTDDNAATEEPAAEEGTRATPFPLGTAITQGDWTITVNSVNLDGTQALADANLFNEPAPEGQVYIIANVSVTYNGANESGEMASPLIDYVTVDGNTIDSFSHMVIAPEAFDSLTTLYPGASTTGNFAFPVPADTAGGGVLAVQAHMLGDKVFVSVQ